MITFVFLNSFGLTTGVVCYSLYVDQVDQKSAVHAFSFHHCIVIPDKTKQ